MSPECVIDMEGIDTKWKLRIYPRVEVSIQKETINITVCFSDPTIEFLTFNYFLMDAEGQRVDRGSKRFCLTSSRRKPHSPCHSAKPK
ncbi:hypothetical protein CDAR_445081 [Caerostris darwini]|uniref:Uncharacterized protein n=1 Tax=Caerostris darwini TaxID=1538125 RepID=A0AAV4MPH8_9ARAC|nr:hypothetical protein CDAR_445081 [Caerostris darwini]